MYSPLSTTLASNSTIIMQNHIASKELSNGVSNNSKGKKQVFIAILGLNSLLQL